MKEILWHPNNKDTLESQVWQFIQTTNDRFDLNLDSFPDLYKWSCDSPDLFWGLVWEYTGVVGHRETSDVLINAQDFLNSEWFPDTKINFAENLLQIKDNSTAIVFWAEDKKKKRMSHLELYQQVSSLSSWLKSKGVVKGDRVAGLLPNMPESVVAMLATASLGAVWTSCSPDFGVEGAVDRFGQVEPKVFICVDAYYYNSKTHDCIAKNEQIINNLPTLESTVMVRFVDKSSSFSGVPDVTMFDKILDDFEGVEIMFEPVSFNDPLYIMFSSGTTGVPKCIVHGVGGTLLQHKKEHQLHCDIKQGDRVFYHSTCGWMMWNWLVSSLSSGATLMLYDGSPFLKHNKNIQFDYAEQEKFNVMGVSAKFIDSARKMSISPIKTHNLESLRLILSTGSVLSVDGFDYVYENIKSDVCLSSISGGTDIISCFVLGSTIMPVHRGELQTRGLGMSVEVWNEKGEAVTNEKGELVCTKTFVSKPVGFWNDNDGSKYSSAYFEKYPNVWCHGDYVSINDNGSMRFYGRSDTVLNPGGVRIGTAEIYRQVEMLDEVSESIAVGQQWKNDVRIILFVKLANGVSLSEELNYKICSQIRVNTTPRHVPAKVIQVTDIPRTKSGKIAELAVQKAIHGTPIDNQTALANPEALDQYYSITILQN